MRTPEETALADELAQRQRRLANEAAPPQLPPADDLGWGRGAFSARLRLLADWPPEYMSMPGKRPPRRFNALTWLQALWPSFPQQFTEVVPDEFWSWAEWDGVTQEDRVAVVACVCGAEPEVEQNRTAICEGRCGRVFMLIGDVIRVAEFEPGELSPSSLQA